MKNHIDPLAIEKSKVHSIVNLIKYLPNTVVTKSILKKSTGNITILSFDAGKDQSEITSSFDTYMQILEGSAEIKINEETFFLNSGEGIIIPAHAKYHIHAKVKFKMISTIIKSGYENL